MLLGKAAFVAALIIQIAIRYPHLRNSVQTRRRSREERFLLVLLSIGGAIIPFIYIFTDRLAFADYGPSPWVISLGIGVMVVGLWLFWRSHMDLGRNWSISLEVHDDHTLVTHGVYRQIRHPMYAAEWLMVIAQACLLSNWVAGFSGIVTFGVMYFLRAPKEEEMMLQQFGEEYQQYMSRTGRIIPKRGFTKLAG